MSPDASGYQKTVTTVLKEATVVSKLLKVIEKATHAKSAANGSESRLPTGCQ
jgi:hypothetical protein